jgi:hypothetical protein
MSPPGVRCFAVELASVVVDVVTPVVAAVAAVAGVGSWRASAKANQTGGGLAAIERGRRHDEVTPEFEITCRERGRQCAGGQQPDYQDAAVLACDRQELGSSVHDEDAAGQLDDRH